ncbi:MAG: hypothetical protein HQL96_01035 [Magnetococcales bacterium]|nr:hypothetical protein [Magnetococcales bacterium]
MTTLRNLQQRVDEARLDCARPLIDALRHAVLRDSQMVGAPPGTLTVQGWFTLIERWEDELERIPARRARYVKSFLQELLEQAEVAGSPIGMAIEELCSLVDANSGSSNTRQAA